MKITAQPQTNLYKSVSQAPAQSQASPSNSTHFAPEDSFRHLMNDERTVGGALLATALGAGQGYLTSKFSDGSTWGAAKVHGGLGAVKGGIKATATASSLSKSMLGKIHPLVLADGAVGAMIGGVAGLASGSILGAVSNHLIPVGGKTAAFTIGGGALSLAKYLVAG